VWGGGGGRNGQSPKSTEYICIVNESIRFSAFGTLFSHFKGNQIIVFQSYFLLGAPFVFAVTELPKT
jgi:hypothetical protein